MIQLNVLQTISVITACSVMIYAVIRALQYMAKVVTAIMGLVDEVKRYLFEHDMMWVDYCIRHNIPIKTDPKGRRRSNGEDALTTGTVV